MKVLDKTTPLAVRPLRDRRHSEEGLHPVRQAGRGQTAGLLPHLSEGCADHFGSAVGQQREPDRVGAASPSRASKSPTGRRRTTVRSMRPSARATISRLLTATSLPKRTSNRVYAMTAKELLDAGKVREAESALTAVSPRQPDRCRAAHFSRSNCSVFPGSTTVPRSSWGFWRKPARKRRWAPSSIYSALHAEKLRHEMFQKQEFPCGPSCAIPAGQAEWQAVRDRICDADPDIGARLELYAAGAYLWIPFEHIASVNIEPPSMLRDTLWTPAFVLTGPCFQGHRYRAGHYSRHLSLLLEIRRPVALAGPSHRVGGGRRGQTNSPWDRRCSSWMARKCRCWKSGRWSSLPMPLREDILKPIPGENPSAQNLRSTPVYDKIKEARRAGRRTAAGRLAARAESRRLRPGDQACRGHHRDPEQRSAAGGLAL